MANNYGNFGNFENFESEVDVYIARVQQYLDSLDRKYHDLKNETGRLTKEEKEFLRNGYDRLVDKAEIVLDRLEGYKTDAREQYETINNLFGKMCFLTTTTFDEAKVNELKTSIMTEFRSLRGFKASNITPQILKQDLDILGSQIFGNDSKSALLYKYRDALRAYNVQMKSELKECLDREKNSYLNEEIAVIDEEDNKTLRDKINNWFNNLSEKERKILMATGRIASTIALIYAILWVNNKINKEDKKDNTVKNNITIEEVQEEQISDSLEYVDVESETPEEKITFERTYIPEYDSEYERIASLYNIEKEDAIDYVNRAHKIFDTSFFNEASIEDIVEVLFSIDSRNLFTTENANLAQLFNTSFNRVVDGYLFGTNTEEDLKALEAIPYFANSETDLGRFLNQFGNITTEIVSEPDSMEAKNKMYDFVNIFATSLNGFTNEESALTDNEEFNESAQINDYRDWYMAYTSFIAPLYPTFSTDETFSDFEELQILMESGLNGPEFEQLCGKTLTLGGE